MTDPNTLPASRELDAQVAERVMGWKRNEFSAGLSWDTPEGYKMWEPSSYGSGFRPSTDIRAAWEVVKKMGSMTSEDPPSKPMREPWHYTVDDAPLAICRAALAAVRAVTTTKGPR